MDTVIGNKQLSTEYLVECIKPDGTLRWVDTFHNLVFTVGLNDSLQQHFKGSAYTAAWYVGLTSGTPSFALGDTMASHAGWMERTDYDEASRQTLTLGTPAAGAVDNSASKAVFTVSATMTFGGAFLVNNNFKGNASGTAYGGGAFSGGNRAAFDNDTITVQANLTASN